MSYIWQNFMEKKNQEYKIQRSGWQKQKRKGTFNCSLPLARKCINCRLLSVFVLTKWEQVRFRKQASQMSTMQQLPTMPGWVTKGKLSVPIQCLWEKDLARNQFLPKAAQPVSTKRNVERTKLESESPNCSFVILKTKSFSFHVQEYLGTYLKNTASSL